MDSSPHSPNDIDTLSSLFFAMHSLVRTRIAQGKRFDPYAWLRAETMLYIEQHDGPSMRAIADHLSVTAPSATSLISGLVRAGFVTRSYNPRDRRSSQIHLTKKGKTFLQSRQMLKRKAVGEVFAVLSHKEFADLLTLLSRILQKQ